MGMKGKVGLREGEREEKDYGNERESRLKGRRERKKIMGMIKGVGINGKEREKQRERKGKGGIKGKEKEKKMGMKRKVDINREGEREKKGWG